MPWMKKKSTVRRRRQQQRRRAPRRYKSVRPLGLKNQGYLHVKRRVPTFTVYDTTGAGEIQSTDTNSITLGTPTLVNGTVSVYDVPFSMNFALSHTVGFSDFTALFEYYKIKNVMIKMSYNGTGTYFNGAPIPEVQYVSDHGDDAIVPLINWEQKMGIKSKTFSSRNAVWLGVNPKPNGVIERGQNEPPGDQVSAMLPGSTPWISSLFYDVKHYGIKGVIRNLYLPAGTAGTAIRVECIYDLEFKGVE